MKKILAIVIIAAVIAACNSNNDSNKTEVKTDSSDTESPLTDAVNTADSVNKKIEAGLDTANMMKK